LLPEKPCVVRQVIDLKIAVNEKSIKCGILQLALCVGLMPAIQCQAQPLNSPMYRAGNGSNIIIQQTQTLPADDAVLSDAPEQINLQFPVPVRLVKLTLRNQQRDWVDIEFRYNPRPAANYTWLLPQLAVADYYIADWAILGDNDQLIRGSFSFAFGPDAKSPSIYRAAEEALLQQRYGDPEIRYVPPPPTTIIIDRDPPRYDPPFTIQLDGLENPDNR
jgi:methionine-rich copper-binding protein CopC